MRESTKKLLKEIERFEAQKEVVIYAEGVCQASVCTSLSDPKEVEAHMPPSGTSLGWKVADEPFRTGEPNPSPCNQDPTRKHFLMAC